MTIKRMLVRAKQFIEDGWNRPEDTSDREMMQFFVSVVEAAVIYNEKSKKLRKYWKRPPKNHELMNKARKTMEEALDDLRKLIDGAEQ